MSFKRKKRDRKERPTRQKPCRFCIDEDAVISYKLPQVLNEYITERCKIVPRRMSGCCRFHQTRLVEAINRARQVALIPYTITHAVRVH